MAAGAIGSGFFTTNSIGAIMLVVKHLFPKKESTTIVDFDAIHYSDGEHCSKDGSQPISVFG